MAGDLDSAKLKARLGAELGVIRYFDEVDSTNRVAAEMAAEGVPEWSLATADYQSAGRGRLGRTWLAPAGGSLLFSLVLRPGLHPVQAGVVNLAAATAVARAAASQGVQTGLKWPNDVVSGGKKLSGILSESTMDDGVVTTLVLGIGVNVNLSVGDFPEEVALTATSLRAESGRAHDRIDVLAAIIHELRPLYSSLKSGRADAVIGPYRELCETLGRAVRVELSEGPFEDVALDVDESGALVLASGKKVNAGDIVHLR